MRTRITKRTIVCRLFGKKIVLDIVESIDIVGGEEK